MYPVIQFIIHIPMAESYSRPIETNDPRFLHTASLYAVRSELSIRWVDPEVKMLRDQECIQVGELIIFVGYCIMNQHKAKKINHYLPIGKHYAYVIRLRYGMQQWFLVIPPEALEKLYKEWQISQDWSEYKLEFTYLESKDIFTSKNHSMKPLLEKWQVLLMPYVDQKKKPKPRPDKQVNIIFNINKKK